MSNNALFNVNSFGTFKGHHKGLTLREQLELFDPQLFVRVRNKMRHLGAPIVHSYAAFLAETSPFCGCGELKHLKGSFTLNECCKTCLKARKQAKSESTSRRRATELLEALPKKLPLKIGDIKKLKSYGRYMGGWENGIDSYRPQFKAEFLSYYTEPPKTNGAFLNFLLQGKPNFCGTCGVALVGTKDRHCKSCRMKTVEMKSKIRSGHERNHGGLGFASKSIQRKAVRTMMERHGVHCGVAGHLNEKAKRAKLDKYGTLNAFEIGDNREKMKARFADPKWVRTWRGKWEAARERTSGEDWRAIDAARLAQARYKHYEVQCGRRILKVQGYEPYVIQELLSRGCPPSKIRVYEERFYYISARTKRRAMYIPDISTGSMIIEVKSTYTAGLTSKSVQSWKELVAKSRAVADSGRELTLCVVNPSKGVFLLKSPHLYTRGEVLRSLQYQPFSYSDEARRNVRGPVD